MALKYRIGDIGWYNFERLVKTLLKKIIGPGVTSFGGSKDNGRDATYGGSAPYPSAHSPWTGEWVFQVKYIDLDEQGAGPSARAALKSTFKKEIKSVCGRHIEIDNYVLITDLPLTLNSRETLRGTAVDAGYPGRFAVVDGNEVCEWLDLHPELRRTFPQLLGLSDLSQLVHSAVYSRSRAYFEQWAPRLALFVQTDAYLKALEVLQKHYFLVLDGPPETGKSMIAAAVATLYASEGVEVFDVRSPDEVHAVIREPGRKIFVADDAIGSISLESDKNDAWTRDLPGILRALDKDRYLIWTARHYILEAALATSGLGDALDRFPGEHEVVVEVGQLIGMEKAEILYNHTKCAKLGPQARTVIRRLASTIAHHPNFTPERIRQMVEHLHRESIDSQLELQQEAMQFLTDPGARWAKAYRALSHSEQALLISLLDLDELPTTTDLKRAYEVRIAHLAEAALTFSQVVSRLRHSFITVMKTYHGIERINFKHPSLRDLLLGELRDDPTARRRYIELTSTVGLARLVEGVAARLHG